MMKRLMYPMMFLFLLLTLCCELPSSEESTQGEPTAVDSGSPEPTDVPVEKPPLPDSHNCQPVGKVLEGGEIWLKNQQVLVTIEADSSTYDQDFGDSYRLLRVYNTSDCQARFKEELPVNRSPDFPYYMASINYNTDSKLIAIRGFEEIYCFDVENNRLLTKLQPAFLTERDEVDAQSGMIQQLELWENFLIGYCRDYGAFVFDLKDRNAIQAIRASAEFKHEDQYNSLFVLESSEGRYQLMIPSFDQNNGSFSVNPLLTEPQQISVQINAKVRNNRFLVLNTGSDNPIAVDMLNRKNINLPPEIRSKKIQEILQWLRAQN